MKRKIIVRCLSFALAGILFTMDPVQVFAAEMNSVGGETEWIIDKPEDESGGEKDETPEILKIEDAQSELEVSDILEDELEQDVLETENGDELEEQIPEEEVQEKEQDVLETENGDELEEQIPEEEVQEKEQDVLETENGDELEEQIPEEEVQEKEQDVLEAENGKEQEETVPIVSVNSEQNNLQESPVTSVELAPSSLTLALNDTAILTPTAFSGEEPIETSFSWSSSNSAVATVNSQGVVTAKQTGKTVIEVEADGIVATCEVTVIIPISGVKLNKEKLSLKKNQSIVLSAIIEPYNTTEDKTLIWSSSEERVVKVDSLGNVIAVGSGTADIIVETLSGYRAVCRVEVSTEEFRLGWQYIEGKWYYYDTYGEKQTGWQCINSKYYYFNVSGEMQTGWVKDEGKWYYLNPDGDRRSGWLPLGGQYYYLDASGEMQTGLVKIENSIYYFSASGEMQTGWHYVSGKWYFLDYNYGAKTGWNRISGKWYYFNKAGEMQTGWQKINDQWYYLNANGEMQIGWQVIDNKKYYLNINGEMQTGWQVIDNKMYYFGTDGAMRTNWQTIVNKTYYFGSDGVVRKGWQIINNKWFYFNSSGEMQTGWKKINNRWYYLNTNGEMQTGWALVNGKWYYLNESGEMLTGWVTVNSKRYYMNQDGIMLTGWQPIGGSWYYFNSDGSMRTGWLQSGSVWYYLKSNGTMATSNIEIDGKTNIFDSNGIWKGVASSSKIKAYGIDVSSNQGTIDWEDVADDGIDFAMLRVVVGKGSNMERDSKFKEYYNGARDAGIDVGVYKYSYATSRTKAREEAQAVIDALNGRKLDYPVVLDVEDDYILEKTDSNSRRSEIILAFKEEIEDAGYEFALYANTTWLNKYLDMDMLDDVDIWVARWRDLDRGHGYDGNVTMWQYSSTGKVDGISGNVDLNVSYKVY